MTNNIDHSYIKKIAKSMFFELTDDQVNDIVQKIQCLNDLCIKNDFESITSKFTLANYTRTVSCSKFRQDIPDKKYNKDYLLNAKKNGKYVEGK